MFYKKYKPSEPLRDLVQDYFIWESEKQLAQPFMIKSPANPCFAMVFNYGDSYQLYNKHHQGTFLPHQFLSGASPNPYLLKLSGKISMAGIIFKGSHFKSIIKTPNPDSFTDDRLDLLDLVGKEASNIVEQLSEASSHQLRIQLIEKFLLIKCNQLYEPKHWVDRAAEIILQRRGIIRMDELAEQCCISPRQLRRTFRARIGIGPKFYSRLKRFNYVDLMLNSKQEFSWNSLLVEDGFYDQSHFLKDYRQFYGRNPSFQILENQEKHLAMGLS